MVERCFTLDAFIWGLVSLGRKDIKGLVSVETSRLMKKPRTGRVWISKQNKQVDLVTSARDQKTKNESVNIDLD